jgi:hypothetical protein
MDFRVNISCSKLKFKININIMKKIIIILLFVYSTVLFSQAHQVAQIPQGITYQAIALNSVGNQLINTNISLKISIIDNTADGSVLYEESHSKTTNNKGLYSLVIGQGTIIKGTFASIDWGKNSKYLKVEMDVTGGTNYTVVGNTQMLSVPYALYSGKTVSIAGNTNINDELIANRCSNFAFAGKRPGSVNEEVFVYNAKLNVWSSQEGTLKSFGFFTANIQASKENFAFAGIRSGSVNDEVFVYNAKLNVWSSQEGSLKIFGSGSTATILEVVGSNGNFAFAGKRPGSVNEEVFVYNANLNAWSSQEVFLNENTTVIKSNGNFAFAGKRPGNANGEVFVYNAKFNAWSSQEVNNTMIQDLDGNGSFAFAGKRPGSVNEEVFVYNAKLNEWSVQIGFITPGTLIVTSPSN